MLTLSSFTDIVALVPAAGIGSRLQSIRPKQYLTIGKFTLLEHSVNCLLAHPDVKKVVIALSSKDNWFDSLALSKDHRVIRVVGGDTRARSVLAGLKVINHCSWVLIHDAVRPCLHLDDLSRLLNINKYNEIGAILATPVHNTIKHSQSSVGKLSIAYTVERKNLWQALTPQFFPCSLLIKCLTSALKKGAIITDDSSALEYCGYYPELVQGRNDNIKITRPEDLALACHYFAQLEKGI